MGLLLPLLFLFTIADAQWLKKIPSSDNLYREAREETDKGNYKRALYLTRQAKDITPRNLDIRLLMSRLYMLTGKYDSAKLELVYIIEKDEKYKDAYVYLVNIEIIKKNYPQALKYADAGLTYYQYDKDLLIKKFEILNLLRNYTESNKVAEQLLYSYPNDKQVLTTYIDQRLTTGREYARRGNFERAKREYQGVLEHDPTNKEALEALYNIDMRSGNYESSLAHINWALQNNPNSYEFLFKKAGILQEMLRYADAVAVAQKLLRLYPNDRKVQQLNVDLRMEAGRYYMNTDAYLQFQGVLEKQPSNREALNYVINLSFSRGLYYEALQWVNQALKYYSGDLPLMEKKIGILENLQRYGAAAGLAETVWQRKSTTANMNRFVDLTIQSGKQFLGDLQYDSAMVAFKRILFYDPSNESALNYAVNVYTAQKNYDEALRVIDQAIKYRPEDPGLAFKKAGILESYGKYEDAAEITRELADEFPGNRSYLMSYIEQSLSAGRKSMEYMDYDNAISRLRDIIVRQPDNKEALNYMINLQSAVKNYDSAVHYVDLALMYYPDSKDLMVKKSSILSDQHQFQEAYVISRDLYEKYPYNSQYKNVYVEQLLASGRNYQQNNMNDSALKEFRTVLSIAPNDTNALYYTINLLIAQTQYDSALLLANHGRRIYPQNPVFLMKKAVIFEQLKLFGDATLAADTLRRLTATDDFSKDYADYLLSRTLKNEAGLFFLRSTFDDKTKLPGHIATMQYLRRHNRGSVTGRINYAGRVQGTGFQFELETYYNHNHKWYSYAVGALSNTIVFPKTKLGYSIFHNMKKGWEAELGIRYLQTDTVETVSGVASLARSIDDFWVNLRGYLITTEGKNYSSAALTTRYYINPNKTDFFSIILGYGTAPDDRSRNYNLENQLKFETVSVGAGIQKMIRYRTTIGIFGTWINQKIASNTYQNQYDIYFTLLRRF